MQALLLLCAVAVAAVARSALVGPVGAGGVLPPGVPASPPPPPQATSSDTSAKAAALHARRSSSRSAVTDMVVGE